MVTVIGNGESSEKLRGTLVELVSNAEAIFNSVKEIRDQTRSEGFEDYETELLLKTYLVRGLILPKTTIRMFPIFQHQIIIL